MFSQSMAEVYLLSIAQVCRLCLKYRKSMAIVGIPVLLTMGDNQLSEIHENRDPESWFSQCQRICEFFKF